MQRRAAAGAEPVVPGVIDTIANAMTLVLAKPLLLLIPVLLDLVLGLSARLSPEALTDALARTATSSTSVNAQQLADSLRDYGDKTDLTPLVALPIPLLLDGIPLLLSGVNQERAYDFWDSGRYGPSSWWFVCLIAVALIVVGVAVSMLYRVSLAWFVRGGPRSPGGLVRSTLVAWVRVLGLLAVIGGLYMLIAGPAIVGGAILQIVGINIVPLLTVVLAMPMIAAMVCLYFVLDAIVVSEVGPLRAIYLSFNVVRRNLWQTLGFAVAAILISVGLPQVFVHMVGTPPGLILAVLCNAFIGTSLVLASMTFYHDRLRRWRPDLATSSPGMRVRPFRSV